MLNIESYVNKKNARRLDDVIKYILVSGKQVACSTMISLLLTLKDSPAVEMCDQNLFGAFNPISLSPRLVDDG